MTASGGSARCLHLRLPAKLLLPLNDVTRTVTPAAVVTGYAGVPHCGQMCFNDTLTAPPYRLLPGLPTLPACLVDSAFWWVILFW